MLNLYQQWDRRSHQKAHIRDRIQKTIAAWWPTTLNSDHQCPEVLQRLPIKTFSQFQKGRIGEQIFLLQTLTKAKDNPNWRTSVRWRTQNPWTWSGSNHTIRTIRIGALLPRAWRSWNSQCRCPPLRTQPPTSCPGSPATARWNSRTKCPWSKSRSAGTPSPPSTNLQS